MKQYFLLYNSGLYTNRGTEKPLPWHLTLKHQEAYTEMKEQQNPRMGHDKVQ